MDIKVQLSNYNLIRKKIIYSNSLKYQYSIKIYYGDQKRFPDDLSDCYQFLSKQEIERSKRLIKKSDMRTYVISHALVNKKIAELLRTDFQKLKIHYFDYKKPYVEASLIDFNLSHSFDYFVFAISVYENIFVGVDTELIRENLDIKPIVNNYFHENEISYVLHRHVNNLNQHQKFYEIWTRKEAFLKMLGTGLSEKLPELDMSSGEREVTIRHSVSLNFNYFSNAHVYTLNLPENLVVSLSVNHPVIITAERCESI